MHKFTKASELQLVAVLAFDWQRRKRTDIFTNFFANLSSSWLVQCSVAKLRLASILVISTPPPPGIVVLQLEIDHIYQPSCARATRSPPATQRSAMAHLMKHHRLLNPKRPIGSGHMSDPRLLDPTTNFHKISFLI